MPAGDCKERQHKAFREKVHVTDSEPQNRQRKKSHVYGASLESIEQLTGNFFNYVDLNPGKFSRETSQT